MTKHFKKFVVGAMVASLTLSAAAALAQEAPTPTLYTAPNVIKKTLDLPCVAAAVAKRETAVSTAFAAKSTAISAAFTKRAADLASAWTMAAAKDRNAAVKAAWKNFNAAAKTARQTYLAANKTAWTLFRSEAKACRAPAQTESAGVVTDSAL